MSYILINWEAEVFRGKNRISWAGLTLMTILANKNILLLAL